MSAEGAASVEGDASVRLFCGLTLPHDVVARVAGWQRTLGSGDFRLVPPENLHLTVAFLGPRRERELEAIAGKLQTAAAAAGPISLRTRRYNETRNVGMVVCDDVGGAGAAFAADLGRRLERLGVYRPEQRGWLPHFTVVRFRRPPRLAPEVPDLEFTPSDAAVYLSRLRPMGAEYVVVRKYRLCCC